ncbi:helix-turn-helix domain-containing protein [Methanothermobacter wolfeii]|uniref:helix-turn-helix domain-containing protein n=1 Tax=Methanothermobacter wolfeii TaxID=145261 RepID=UPI0024B38ED1|nr:helix-turn-helix transcriptional regulator [Methanothermobacter wolfeii]MDI6701368.1 helix-turn-helix transcriptional regulator [Methanothermobacter wolfeii]MDI6842028.1 helix-turn-helix transcriptional regulator [Methanothermobacter wolfeii]
MREDDLKFLILGYRVHSGKTQRELADELGVPPDIVIAMENGTYRHPTRKLMEKIEDLIGEYEVQKRHFINIGRGYRLREMLGTEFKYFIQGLDRMKYVSRDELEGMDEPERYGTLGAVEMDAFEVLRAGKMS